MTLLATPQHTPKAPQNVLEYMKILIFMFSLAAPLDSHG
jgi:hypothetical protein